MILSKNEKYKTRDNLELFLKKDLVNEPKAVILIVHGLAEHCGRYDYVTSKLNNLKYNIYRFDNRGHGKSDGDKIYIDDYNKFVDDVDEIIELVKAENKNKQVYILGHSMGGMISTIYGINHPKKVDGIIISAGVTCDNANLMTPNINLDPHHMVDNKLSSLICTNREIVDNYNNDPLVAHKISGSMFIECNKAINYIKKNMHNFNYPVFILHGSDDKIVDKQDSITLFENINSRYKKIKIYAGMYHEILNEFERDEVIADINNWIRKDLK